jgi:hypothetical protein
MIHINIFLRHQILITLLSLIAKIEDYEILDYISIFNLQNGK